MPRHPLKRKLLLILVKNYQKLENELFSLFFISFTFTKINSKEQTPYFILFLFLTNVAHLKTYKCLEINFGAITAYLLYRFPKGWFCYLVWMTVAHPPFQKEGLTLPKKCLYSELFWSAFFRIRTEYGERYVVSLRILSDCGKMLTRITPNTFHAVKGH